METIAKSAAFVAIAVCSPLTSASHPEPPLVINESEMPQFAKGILEEYEKNKDTFQAITIYHDLRKSFHLSHTTMGNWLGVKRRSLYNWMNAPESSVKYGDKIENRLVALSELKDEMESEHLPLIEKIAFSNIYGDQKFGEAILEGSSSKELIDWYDKLFSRFESYRRALKNKSHIE